MFVDVNPCRTLLDKGYCSFQHFFHTSMGLVTYCYTKVCHFEVGVFLLTSSKRRRSDRRLRIGQTRLTHGQLLTAYPAPLCEHCAFHLAVRCVLVDFPSCLLLRQYLYPTSNTYHNSQRMLTYYQKFKLLYRGIPLK